MKLIIQKRRVISEEKLNKHPNFRLSPFAFDIVGIIDHPSPTKLDRDSIASWLSEKWGEGYYFVKIPGQLMRCIFKGYVH